MSLESSGFTFSILFSVWLYEISTHLLSPMSLTCASAKVKSIWNFIKSPSLNFNSLENFICLLWRCKNIIMMFCDKRNSRNCLSWTLDEHKTLHKHKTVWKMQHKTSVSSSYWKSWHRINFTEHFMRRKMDLFTDYCQQRLVGRLVGGFVKAAELLLCCALDLERDHTFVINSFWPKW